MTVATDDLPDDIEHLKALLLAERSEKDSLSQCLKDIRKTLGSEGDGLIMPPTCLPRSTN